MIRDWFRKPKTYKVVYTASYCGRVEKRTTYIRAKRMAQAVMKLIDQYYPEHVSIFDIQEVQDD